MESNEDLARLEQFVEKLILSHNQLKNENSEMNAQLLAKQQEVVELRERVKDLQEDKSVVHSRVTGLIDRINDWEKTIDQEGLENQTSGNGETQSPPNRKSSLFNETAEQTS